jgi:hypothetical protein
MNADVLNTDFLHRLDTIRVHANNALRFIINSEQNSSTDLKETLLDLSDILHTVSNIQARLILIAKEFLEDR